MGGAVGHLMHLYDDHNLTFQEIVDILKSAADGTLENVTEKFDGLNLVFSWDISSDSLKVARAGGDIKRGGMDATSLAAKFSGRGDLATTFNSAFETVDTAIRSLPFKKKKQVFGAKSNRWYSMEIIDSKNSNVINYDYSAIIFHAWPSFVVQSDGSVEMTTDDISGIATLVEHVESMNLFGWKLLGPAKVNFTKRLDDSLMSQTATTIEAELSSLGLNLSSTLHNYIEKKLRHDISGLNLSDDITTMMVNRCLSNPGAPTLVGIKKIANKSNHRTITEFIKSSEKRLKSYIRPIEIAINDFATGLLKNVKSTLIVDSKKEINRLQEETERAIGFIKSCDDKTAIDILTLQMQKLKSTRNVSSSVEGIVFLRGNNAYKFTGNFAAMGQILGLFKYGRGGVKLKMAS
jgi:hypothetical protein